MKKLFNIGRTMRKCDLTDDCSPLYMEISQIPFRKGELCDLNITAIYFPCQALQRKAASASADLGLAHLRNDQQTHIKLELGEILRINQTNMLNSRKNGTGSKAVF